MAHRIIFDTDPDPSALFDELHFQGARDGFGVPLGDVAGHARRRFTACYGALCLTRLLVELGRIPSPVDPTVTGALYQDKQTSREFPAAHVLPCDLTLSMPGHPPPGARLSDLLRNPLNRIWAQREIFGRTDRVHRLTNVVDRRCEAGDDGMGMILAACCDDTIRGALRSRLAAPGGRAAPVPPPPAIDAFDRGLVTGFLWVARNRLDRLEAEFTALERAELTPRPLLDRFGKSIVAGPTDLRLSAPSPRARAAVRAAMRQILEIYADPACVDRSALGAMANTVEAVRHNERGH